MDFGFDLHNPVPDAAGPALVIEQAHPNLRLSEERLRTVVHRVIDGEGAALRYLGLILTGHATVRALGRTYLDHDHDTDVLSFPLSEDDGEIDGEVYVDLDTARERHAEFGASFEEEALRYAVHGLLHLIGYDDADPAARRAMRRREDRYLKRET